MTIILKTNMPQLNRMLLILFFSIGIRLVNAQSVNMYISTNGKDSNNGLSVSAPLSTLQEAFLRISLRKEKLPVNILLSGGVYHLKQPVRVLPEYSGTAQAPVTIRPLGDEQVTFDGSLQIRGWKKYKGTIWYTTIPEVKKGSLRFGQLFINGQSRTLARFPNDGFYTVAGFPDGGTEVDFNTGSKRFKFRRGDIDPHWTNMEDVRVVVYHFWSDAHLQIDKVDVNDSIVTFKYPAEKRFTDDFSGDGARYFVENVFEGLDKPGEWYLNDHTGVLYYIPMMGEDLATSTVVVPVLSGFLSFDGDAIKSRYVNNIHFSNITFKYANFIYPDGDAGDLQAAVTVPGAITFKGAKNCSFNNCTFENLGTMAFDVQNGCSALSLKHNTITHTAAGGFRVNGGTEESHPLERTANITISDNEIGYYGERYPSAVGVLLMNTEGNYVGHNHLHHGWYTGISIGWKWGYERSISRDNIIEYNHIEHIGQGLLSDMGGIYTLGVSPGTIIRNNLIHDVQANRYGGWGIYNDEGSAYLLIENNIVYNTKFAPYNIHYAKELTVRNNIFAFGKLEELNRTKGEPHPSVYLEKNIIYWDAIKDPYSADWKDQTYAYHVDPRNKKQPIKTSNFYTDYNIFFNPRFPLDSLTFNGNSWLQWHKSGKDIHSLYCDPMFVDPGNFNFKLKPGSPAFLQGFKQIDMSTVGIRKK